MKNEWKAENEHGGTFGGLITVLTRLEACFVVLCGANDSTFARYPPGRVPLALLALH